MSLNDPKKTVKFAQLIVRKYLAPLDQRTAKPAHCNEQLGAQLQKNTDVLSPSLDLWRCWHRNGSVIYETFEQLLLIGQIKRHS